MAQSTLVSGCDILNQNQTRRYAMQWIDPDFCDLRLGFEVTAYVYVR